MGLSRPTVVHMTFELWDNKTANLLASETSEAEIISLVRIFLENDGAEFVEHLGYCSIDADGETVEVLTGPALIQRVRETIAA